MKHSLCFELPVYGVVLSAMRGYRALVAEDQKKMFDIAYNKVLATNKPELDGMEMILIVKALRRRANLFLLLGKETERGIYLELANEIDRERQKFQYQFYRSYMQKEKAASDTLTAI
ncbi:hypothetical protein AT864_01482 [Anoxybacillus sp. P3H1B]|nr:hypothetical protein AT864_01482 [Anoxybacillus sp. P3H1B]